MAAPRPKTPFQHFMLALSIGLFFVAVGFMFVGDFIRRYFGLLIIVALVGLLIWKWH